MWKTHVRIEFNTKTEDNMINKKYQKAQKLLLRKIRIK